MSNIFEEVKQQLNIRQVIEHYGIRIGRNNKFKCVFHNDKNHLQALKMITFTVLYAVLVEI